MRLEDLIVRYLPEGGAVLDSRPEGLRGQLSLSADARVTVGTDTDTDKRQPDLVLLDPGQLDAAAPAGRWTVVLAETPADAAPVADMLAWAGSHGGQLVEAAGILAPRCVALVVEQTADALVPTQPGVPAGSGDAATWRRVAGELVIERFRNTVLTERAERAEQAVAAEKARAEEARQKLRTLRRRLKEPQQSQERGRLSARVARLGRKHG